LKHPGESFTTHDLKVKYSEMHSKILAFMMGREIETEGMNPKLMLTGLYDLSYDDEERSIWNQGLSEIGHQRLHEAFGFDVKEFMERGRKEIGYGILFGKIISKMVDDPQSPLSDIAPYWPRHRVSTVLNMFAVLCRIYDKDFDEKFVQEQRCGKRFHLTMTQITKPYPKW
jgi:hypothetical protein